MRRFVNGVETVLGDTDAEVSELCGRLMVRTADGAFSALAVRTDSAVLVSFKGRQYRVEERQTGRRSVSHATSGELRAPMPGQIVDVRSKAGDCVRKGQTILVLEAMKTQQPFLAPFDGKLTRIAVEKGAQVDDGALLAVVEAVEAQNE